MTEADSNGSESIPRSLPHIWAVCLSRLAQEVERRSWLPALWFLRDAVECGVRLLVAVGAAERISQAEEADDPRQLEQFARLLQQPPSLGAWVSVLRGLCEDARPDSFCNALAPLSRGGDYAAPWN